MDSDSVTLSRIKQTLNLSLTVIGLSLFVFIGSKAIGQIDDSRYTEGMPKTYTASNALMTADMEVSAIPKSPTTLTEQESNASDNKKDIKAPADIAISQTTKKQFSRDKQDSSRHAPAVRQKPAEKRL